MSIILGQVAVPGNATVAAFTVPVGLANFTVWQQTTPQTVYIGPGTAVSTVNGMQVPNTPFLNEDYVAGKAVTFYATTGNATASTFQYILVTGSGI